MTTPDQMNAILRAMSEEDKKKQSKCKARPLQEYLDIMGVDKGLFAFMCSIPDPVVDRVLAGLSITNNHVMQIMRELRKAFSEDLDIKHVIGLSIV